MIIRVENFSSKKYKEWKNSTFFFGFASEQAVIGHANANDNRQFLISTLLNLLQIKYQNLGKSPFDTHTTIMLLFIVTTYFYGVALVAISRQIPNRSYLPLAMLICDILSVLASSLLVSFILPPFGWLLLFLCVFVLILRVLHGSNRQIFELLHAFQCIVFSTFQHIFKRPHQASNNNSMEQEGNGGVLMV
jgi:hypothetical protein